MSSQAEKRLLSGQVGTIFHLVGQKTWLDHGPRSLGSDTPARIQPLRRVTIVSCTISKALNSSYPSAVSIVYINNPNLGSVCDSSFILALC